MILDQNRAVLVVSVVCFQKIFSLHGLNHQIIEYWVSTGRYWLVLSATRSEQGSTGCQQDELSENIWFAWSGSSNYWIFDEGKSDYEQTDRQTHRHTEFPLDPFCRRGRVKTVESYAIWFGIFDNIIWRELLVSLYLPPNFCGTAFPGQESPLDIAIFLWSGNNLGFKILENPNDYFSRKLPWYSSGAAIQIQLFSSSTLFTFFNLYVLLEKIRSGPYTSFYFFCFVF